ncbi:unknown [Firmicutes bacterium CAG:791]|nr:unknown [Firmicutes bacterium CAG:791]
MSILCSGSQLIAGCCKVKPLHFLRIRDSVLRLVDQRLRVRNPEPDGKILGLHRNLKFAQHPDGVARTVSRCKNHGICPKDLLASAKLHSGSLSPVDQNSLRTGFKTDLTAKTFDFFPKLQNHTAQAIGSDMRNLFVGNILRGSRPKKPG